MATIIQDLRKEHADMDQLLRLLDLEVKRLQEENGADFELMLQILEYTACYPELFHHPKEDIVFRKLVARDRDAEALVNPLLEEHKELEQLTREFLTLLKRVTAGDIVPRDHVEKIAHDYIQFNRRHINTEEGQVFPRIEKTLLDEDWAAIEAEMPGVDDPLFGECIQDPYRELYERIVRIAS